MGIISTDLLGMRLSPETEFHYAVRRQTEDELRRYLSLIDEVANSPLFESSLYRADLSLECQRRLVQERLDELK